jgi:hypothetical protein
MTLKHVQPKGVRICCVPLLGAHLRACLEWSISEGISKDWRICVLVTSCIVWNGGMVLHKTQEFLHPLGAKVFWEAEACLCSLERESAGSREGRPTCHGLESRKSQRASCRRPVVVAGSATAAHFMCRLTAMASSRLLSRASGHCCWYSCSLSLVPS